MNTSYSFFLFFYILFYSLIVLHFQRKKKIEKRWKWTWTLKEIIFLGESIEKHFKLMLVSFTCPRSFVSFLKSWALFSLLLSRVVVEWLAKRSILWRHIVQSFDTYVCQIMSDVFQNQIRWIVRRYWNWISSLIMISKIVAILLLWRWRLLQYFFLVIFYCPLAQSRKLCFCCAISMIFHCFDDKSCSTTTNQ